MTTLFYRLGMISKALKIGIVISILIVLGAIFILIKAKRDEAELPIAKTYSITVSTFKVEKQQVSLTLPYIAQTQNDMDVNLASKIAARVDYVKNSGVFVKKGEIIAKLDATSIEANQKSIESQLAATKTALKNLEATHKRTLELLAVKGASIEQSESEESRIAELEAKVESLNQSLNDVSNTLTYAIIKSPVDGMISKNTVNVGDMIMPGQPVATISASSDYYLMLYVPSNVKVYRVIVDNKSYPAIPLNATMNGLTAYRVNVEPGGMMTGERVEVNVEVFNGVGIKIPFDGILNRDNKSYVFVKENDKAIPTEINIIQSGEDGAVISNNELAGKEIVVAKQDILLTLLSGATLKTEGK
ncbi:MAG TPA: efflux RND transporter periplasmic adaptor subunit [Ignavibacteriaceae bacterium]|nr:efflux RND transporter periplasmic adaptor subunit [Ignavibacteriaceae bacterium]